MQHLLRPSHGHSTAANVSVDHFALPRSASIFNGTAPHSTITNLRLSPAFVIISVICTMRATPSQHLICPSTSKSLLIGDRAYCAARAPPTPVRTLPIPGPQQLTRARPRPSSPPGYTHPPRHASMAHLLYSRAKRCVLASLASAPSPRHFPRPTCPIVTPHV